MICSWLRTGIGCIVRWRIIAVIRLRDYLTACRRYVIDRSGYIIEFTNHINAQQDVQDTGFLRGLYRQHVPPGVPSSEEVQ